MKLFFLRGIFGAGNMAQLAACLATMQKAVGLVSSISSTHHGSRFVLHVLLRLLSYTTKITCQHLSQWDGPAYIN